MLSDDLQARYGAREIWIPAGRDAREPMGRYCMKRVWRNGGRVLSAILAVAMIFTSLPVSGVTVYADEGTPVDDEASSGGESSTEDKDLSVDSDPMILEDSALEELAALDDETAYASSTEEINLALAEDYTWDEDGTTITGLAKEYTWDQQLTLRIPAQATRIASGAFKRDNSSSLTIVALVFQGDNILIEDSAFYHSKLKKITLPGGTTFSSGHQFDNCQFLTDITLENGITEIPEYAFNYNCDLKEIVIPNSVTVIGAHAFDSCSKLASVNPSNGLREIRDNAFEDCKSLEWFSIPTSVETIGSEAFTRSGIKALNITAENVTYGDRAFAYCSSLSTVEFKGLQSVSYGMFMSCTNLTRVVLPEGLEIIGGYAFSGCSALSDIDLPDTVASLGGGDI